MEEKEKNINYENLKRFKENVDNIIPKRVTLTQAEYDLLSYEEKHNGTVYFVSDGIANITESDKGYIDSQDTQTLNSAKDYIDTKVETLNEAIDTKATTTDLTAHTNNIDNPHEVTKAQVGLDKVENKSSADIRGELTKSDVTAALGFTPPINGFTKQQAVVTYTSRDGNSPIGSCTIPSCGDGFMTVTSNYDQYLYLITCRSSIHIHNIYGTSEIPTATRNSDTTISISNIPYIGEMSGYLNVYSFK